MSRSIKYFLLYFLIFTITGGVSFAQWDPNKTIRIEALPKVVKGFPVVIKVNVEGYQRVPYLSIQYDDLSIRANLTSKTDGKVYAIQSYRRREAVGGSRGGGLMDLTDQIDPPLEVPEGQTYSMIFDLWSILPHLHTDTFLSDIPAGKYSLRIEFYSERLKSDSIDIELIDPDEQEKMFIDKIRESGKIYSGVRLKDGLNWVKVLFNDTAIANNDMSKLTQISKDQLSLHKMILDVNITDEQTIEKSIQDVDKASIPKFLEPEKQLLLFELKGNQTQDRERLFQKYPQLRGMLERFDSNYKPFTGYKEARKRRLQYKSQTTKSKEPNL